MHISLSRVTGGVLFGLFFVSFSVPSLLFGLPSFANLLWMGLGTAAMGIWMWPFVAENWATMAERRGPRQIDWSRVPWQSKFWLAFFPGLVILMLVLTALYSRDSRMLIGWVAYAGVAVVVCLGARLVERRYPRPWPTWATSLSNGLFVGFIVTAGLVFLADAPLDWPRLILAGLVSGVLVTLVRSAISRVATRWVQEQRVQPT